MLRDYKIFTFKETYRAKCHEYIGMNEEYHEYVRYAENIIKVISKSKEMAKLWITERAAVYDPIGYIVEFISEEVSPYILMEFQY